jgi:hypothetical protein
MWVFVSAWIFACGGGEQAPCMEGFHRSLGGTCDPASKETGRDTAVGDTMVEQVEPAPEFVALESGRLLRRISLDLRGVLPSLAELEEVASDPSRVDALRDAYLEDPRFEERLVQLFAEQWHTQVDEFLVTYREYQALASSAGSEFPFERAVGDEPLRLMAHIAATDQPFSEILTADYTLANELLASIWNLDYPADSEGWQVSRYTDDRPAAGVLSTNGLWWRYHTTVSNYNRGRVAALVRLLICEDYLARPVSLEEADIGEDEEVEDALRSNPYCMGCHSSLDPIASALFGFYSLNEYNIFEIDRYHAEREPLGTQLLGTQPEWFGVPISGLDELGSTIAQDPRFPRCVAERMTKGLLRRDVGLDDFQTIELLRQEFVDSGLQLKALVRAITSLPAYRAADVTGAEVSTMHLLGAPRLASIVEDLSGFRWSYWGFDLMSSDTNGYRVMAGGVDGAYVSDPQRTPGLTWMLVTQRLAEAGSASVIEGFGSSESELFSTVSSQHVPGDSAFESTLDALVLRLAGRAPDDTHREELVALWQAVRASGSAEEAWRVLFAVLMQDPEILSY